ncbi:MAG: Formamidopyrimidine-DNA glycosylase [Verrucomicrobia subdivision 3 bacterium]|nr:Formamidopyrimidine-DNA glycosylase [Limisphaerales bacterium]MCS1415295.1 Formamidopyrimidine-DNA glycosylase [Limisphaerales bacterium]
MPELPEVEVLVRHLQQVLPGRRVAKVSVIREKSVRPNKAAEFAQALLRHRFDTVQRRAKFLIFTLSAKSFELSLIGHLGMTGRIYVQKKTAPLPKHAAVVIELDRGRFVFEDTRYFGRMTLDRTCLNNLGPEPLSNEFEWKTFHRGLQHSGQAIKVRLLAQDLVVGVGNIYACEALFRAGIDPRATSSQLTREQVRHLQRCIQETMAEAIALGSTLPLDLAGTESTDGLFYFGQKRGVNTYEERLLVYGRKGEPCYRCQAKIQRIVQAARGTFFCPRCQTRRIRNRPQSRG